VHSLAAIDASIGPLTKVADSVLNPDDLVLAAVGMLPHARLGELRQVITDGC